MASLIDTCVLIDLLRGSEQASQTLNALRVPAYVSGVSVTELFAGVRSQKDEIMAERLLAAFRKAETSDLVWRVAGHNLRHYGSSHAIGTADAIIAATAEVHGLELLTLNIEHFPMFKRLRAAY
ncbi:MAG: PIN domain-containing protein [Hyphomicrobium aestuarii]|nr:PIN domain-containing protein [Hyphomicrobium aestuarii]